MTREAPAAVVMAAGKSTRMKSDLPKVLHPLCGRPMLDYVLDAVAEAGIARTVVVVGFGADQVRQACAGRRGVDFALQAEQKGTGHAVMICRELLAECAGPVLVLAGDGPFVRPAMIRRMIERAAETEAAAYLATASIDDPTGYGRILRDADGGFSRIVEQKDASPQEAAVREINASFYLFDGKLLFEALDAVRPDNAQGEYYLTDVPAILKKMGRRIVAEPLADAVDIFGVNHRRHLAQAHRLMQQRIHDRLMDEGVTIVDPAATMIDARARIGRDTVIEPFTVIEGPCVIGARCRIGPFVRVAPHSEFADGTILAGTASLNGGG